MKNFISCLTHWRTIVWAWVIILVGIPQWKEYTPASNWFVIDSIRINSTFVGNDPTMKVDRDLKFEEPTLGSYTVTLYDKNHVTVCSNSETQTYRPNANLPRVSNFNFFAWWMGLKKNETPADVCNKWPLPAGLYCSDTVWKFYPDRYPPKNVSYRDACFLFVARPDQNTATHKGSRW